MTRCEMGDRLLVTLSPNVNIPHTLVACDQGGCIITCARRSP